MKIKFDLYRFSLLERSQMDFLMPQSLTTREEYLKIVFLQEQQFSHRKNFFYYFPKQLEEGEERDEIIGHIGRSIVINENLPPSKNFEESKRDTWKASVVIIDPKDHADGQKVAIGIDGQLGKTAPIIKSLVASINNKNRAAKYHIEVAPITDSSSFWENAKKYSGRINVLTFTFIAPNMFGGTDEIKREMRRFKKEEKAQKIKISISSDDGINTDTEKVKSSVEYIELGGGDITAKASGARSYSSKNTNRQTAIVDSSQKSILDKVGKQLMKVLGRE
jgi:hypothetical protein